jgi:hypothetical protein
LAPGPRLGVYDITAPIGEGGMGCARDTELGCGVANKILPEAFAHDADSLMRFHVRRQCGFVFGGPFSEEHAR